MKRNMAVIVGVILNVCVCSALIIGCAASPQPQPKEAGVLEREPIGTVNIFAISDLTGPGADAAAPLFNGFWDQIRNTNDQGGIIYDDPKTGREERVIINFDWGDNKAQAGPVPTMYERMSSVTPTPPLCYMGSTASCDTVVPWTKRDHIVQINGPASLATWWPPAWSFAITPDYPGQACTAAWWALQDWRAKGKTEAPGWAWYTLDMPFGRAMITPESEAYIKGLGFKIVGLWTVPFSPVDTSTELNAMIKAGVNYCYGNLVTRQESLIMKDVTRLNLKDKLQIISCPYGIGELILEQAGAAADGLVGVHYSAWPDEMDKPGVEAAYNLAKKYNRPWTTDILLGNATGYLTIGPLKRALESKGYPITGEDVYEVMLDTEGYSTGGILPQMTFTETERRGCWICYMRAVKGGKIIRISDDFHIPDMRPLE